MPLKSRPQKSLEAIRAELAGRLRMRYAEIEQAIGTRIRRLSDPVADQDPAYVACLRDAIAAALGYGIEGIEKGNEWSLPIPSATTKQARRAARDGVSLNIVLRSYAAGNKALEEFIVAEADGIPGRVLCQILGDQGPRIDRLLESVACEYEDERERAKRSPPQREADRVVHLLQSDGLVGPDGIDYDFDIWHVGMILKGRNGDLVTRSLAQRFGYRSLHVARDHETAWAWLGSTRPPAPGDLKLFFAENAVEISVAAGEPRVGLSGWRLTHREAQVALEAMLQKPQRLTRGRNVILRVGVTRDDTLVRSLIDTYLAPLEEHVNSEKLLEALRAYFHVGGNAASAAALLGVTRHTVQRRIRTIEQTLEQPFHSCYAELQVALQIAESDGFHRESGLDPGRDKRTALASTLN